MILERFPAVRRLPTPEKTQLIIELLEEVQESKAEVSDPVLLEILRQRRATFEADPSTARRWDELRDSILKRADR
jgi:hypothetical protein